MNKIFLLIGLVVVLILLLFAGVSRTRPVPQPAIQPALQSIQPVPQPGRKYVSYLDLTAGEKLQYIVDTYFGGEDDESDDAAHIRKQQDEYIESLPKDDKSCSDDYDGCAEWAAAGECEINPEYMLYHCAKSCNACSLNPQQKNDLVGIYNSRELKSCCYHSDHKNYPGAFPYLFELYSYSTPLL